VFAEGVLGRGLAADLVGDGLVGGLAQVLGGFEVGVLLEGRPGAGDIDAEGRQRVEALGRDLEVWVLEAALEVLFEVGAVWPRLLEGFFKGGQLVAVELAVAKGLGEHLGQGRWRQRLRRLALGGCAHVGATNLRSIDLANTSHGEPRRRSRDRNAADSIVDGGPLACPG